MRKFCTIAVMSVTALMLLAVGCDTTKAPPGVGGDPLPQGTYPRVAALEGLDDHLVYGEIVVEPGEEDRPMRVTVPIRGTSRSRLNIQYQFLFFDAKGRPVKSNTAGWSFANLEPRIEKALDGSALDRDAVDWRLTIRPAR